MGTEGRLCLTGARVTDAFSLLECTHGAHGAHTPPPPHPSAGILPPCARSPGPGPSRPRVTPVSKEPCLAHNLAPKIEVTTASAAQRRTKSRLGWRRIQRPHGQEGTRPAPARRLPGGFPGARGAANLEPRELQTRAVNQLCGSATAAELWFPRRERHRAGTGRRHEPRPFRPPRSLHSARPPSGSWRRGPAAFPAGRERASCFHPRAGHGESLRGRRVPRGQAPCLSAPPPLPPAWQLHLCLIQKGPPKAALAPSSKPVLPVPAPLCPGGLRATIPRQAACRCFAFGSNTSFLTNTQKSPGTPHGDPPSFPDLVSGLCCIWFGTRKVVLGFPAGCLLTGTQNRPERPGARQTCV